MKMNKVLVALCVAGVCAPQFANATNGMNLSGYGPEAHAMGGASMAYDNGTAAVMNNPATLGLMKDESARLDLALGGLFPTITSSMTGMPAADSSAKSFFMPAMGYARRSGPMTYGVALFSQGGMGTEYGANSFLASGGVAAGTGQKVRSEVGVGRFIVPLAYNVNNQLTVAGSVDFVWAGMDLMMALPGMMSQGEGSFQDMVSSFGGTQKYGTASGNLVSTLQAGFGPNSCGAGVSCLSSVNWARVDFSNTDKFTGAAKGNGFAGKLGATFKVNESLTLGGSFHSKTAMSDLKTSGATMSMNLTGNAFGVGSASVPVTGSVAVHNFQWPMTLGLGGAYQLNDQVLLVADYRFIGWKDSMKDFSMTFTADATQANAVATQFGMGGKSVDMTLKQNWDNQNVIQLGGAFKANSALTLRAGLNLANNPVPNKYVNPLFPAVAKTNISGGLGYVFDKASSVDMSFAYVPTNTVTGGNGVKVDFGGTSAQFVYSYRY